jgi:adenylate cyclase
MKNFRRKTTWLHLVILLVLVGAAVQGITWAGWLERPESIYSDLWHQLAGRRYSPEHVAIVTLDETTLTEHPDEPLVCWTPHFARVIEILRAVGARIMGLDYLYYVSIEDWLKKLNLPPNHPSLKYDQAFKAQLASGRVVMAANLGVDELQKV